MKRVLTLLPIVALSLAACGSDDPGISIDGAWARTTAEGQTTGAIYFSITSDEADTLIGASVPASVAAEAQIHEVVAADMSGDDMEMDEMSGDDMSGDMQMDDMSGDMEMDGEMPMVMQEMESGLPLPAGETVTLQPGGYHVMLLDIAEPLEVGDKIDVTLDFADADDMTITVEVAESAP